MEIIDLLRSIDTYDFGPRKWVPSVDIQEVDSHYLLRVEVPGVGRENLKIEVDHGHLTISGKKEAPAKGVGYRYSEIGFGSFVRSFELPPKAGEIFAEYLDGVLSLKIHKGEGVSRQIQIK